MNDIVRITELEVHTHIGVPEAERKEAQRLLVSVVLETSTQAAARSDAMEDTINYEAVTKNLQELARTERKTIERFAEDATEMILSEFHPKRVTVTVQKFPLKEAKSVSVTITRP
ncbi:dihydroneopterin aldolase [Candidatus Peregrinibacteria bacterium CG10_big_fil_rev_8_21_14_0_10_49_10]|nr:MAG: dihydroneopterin aldolase [Candidatus Peregrinibacteria bacterium CG10_big_fil_rev_8_21_14_0_10_49_10]